MTERREIKDWKFFSAQAALGTSSYVLDVSDFRDVVLSFATASSGSMTIKVLGALAVIGSDNAAGQGVYVAPNFSAVASQSNAWTYLQSVNLDTGVAINGSTGIVYAGTDSVKLVEVNTNAVDFLTVAVTNYSAGNVTVKCAAVTNQ